MINVKNAMLGMFKQKKRSNQWQQIQIIPPIDRMCMMNVIMKNKEKERIMSECRPLMTTTYVNIQKYLYKHNNTYMRVIFALLIDARCNSNYFEDMSRRTGST